MPRILAFLLNLVVLCSVYGQATPSYPVTNLSTGNGYESIGQAVEAANAGDHIQMAALSFVEHVAIGIPLTLSGSQTGTTVIDVSEEDGWGITLSSDGITLEHFTVVAGGVNMAYAIHSEPGITGLTIEELSVVGSTKSCIDLNGLTGPQLNTIRNVNVTGSATGFGLALSTCSNVLVENITSVDNSFGDIALMESNYYSQEIHDVAFTGYLQLEGPQSLGGGGIVVQIDPAEVPVGIGAGFPISINVDGFEYLLEAPGDLTGCILVSAEDVRGIAATLGANVNPLVSYDMVTQDMVVFPGMSVQSALDAADDGTTIKVEAGTFDTAPLEINNSVTIVGANAGVTGTQPQGRNAESILPGIVVTAGHPSIDGVRIVSGAEDGVVVGEQASGLHLSNSVIIGGSSPGSRGLLGRHDVEVHDVRISGYDQAVRSEGGTLVLEGSLFKDYGAGFTLASGGGAEDILSIEGCTFESAGALGIHLVSGDAGDALTVQQSLFNLHGTAFRLEDGLGLVPTIVNNVFSNSESQVEGADRDTRIGLCAANDFDPSLRITGCTDPGADNFEACANIDQGCQYHGCTAPKACNFDVSANVDDGSCDFITCAGCPLEFACNYDPEADLYKVEACNFVDCGGAGMTSGGIDRSGALLVEGCTIPQACNYDPDAATEDGSCTFDCYGCMEVSACNFDAAFTHESNATCLYIADLYNSPHVDCQGVCLNDANGNGICDEVEVVGCTDAEACNFSADATLDDGGCDFASCAGCTNPAACNHDPAAWVSDDSCDYSSCSGCTEEAACNYDGSAVLDDGSCTFPVDLYNKSYLDCDAGCLNDLDGDGICDEEEIGGCTDNGACNFHATATDDDGTCDYLTCSGCTDADYCNYNPSATIDNGSCAAPADLFPDAVVDGVSTVDCLGRCLNDEDGNGICDEAENVCPGDLNGDGLRGAADILQMLGAFGCTSSCGLEDLNGDGIVAANDILMALSTFGMVCP